jgi:hypothetical protein
MGNRAEEVKWGSDNLTQSGSLENFWNSTTKAIRASKRLKKKTLTKKMIFFMVKAKCSKDGSPLLIFHQNICGLRKKRPVDTFHVS